MKKSDLKSKMVVQLRNGLTWLVVDDVLLRNGGFDLLYDYNDDLTHETFKEDDIIKVYKYNNKNYEFTNDLGVHADMFQLDIKDKDYQLLWERKEITLTEQERKALEALSYDWCYIVRNVNKNLCVLDNSKTKIKYIQAFNHLFDFIKWKDEPYEIKELLDNG